MTTRPRSRRALLTGAAALVGGLALAACSSPPAAPTTTTVELNHGPAKPIATIRAAYLADTATVSTAFTTFSTRFEALGGQGTNDQLDAIVAPILSTLKTSIKKVYALRLETTTKIGKAIVTAVEDDQTVYDGLVDLRSGYGSRSFDLSSWGSAFATAIQDANSSANVVRKDLGLKPLATSG